MPLSGRSWKDSRENYADGYILNVSGTTSTAIQGKDYLQPAVVYSLSLSMTQAGSTGDVTLVDGSATADAGDTRVFVHRHASGGSGERPVNYQFPRGIVFGTGVIVSATTITGTVNLTFKPRYPS